MDINEVEKIKSNIKNLINSLDNNVRLIAVTKAVDTEHIELAINAGIKEIGENKVQDAVEKYSVLKDMDIKWHYIGHLQKNKVKDAVKIFDLIHSVDGFDLADRIDKYAKSNNKIQDILLQVNVSEEKTKFGLHKGNVDICVNNIKILQNVRLKGLMTIGPNTKDENIIRTVFRELKELRDRFIISNPDMDILSMGMTDDYQIAVQEGSNMLRIGRKIFSL